MFFSNQVFGDQILEHFFPRIHHPRKLKENGGFTWKIRGRLEDHLNQTIIFRFDVNLRGCNQHEVDVTTNQVAERSLVFLLLKIRWFPETATLQRQGPSGFFPNIQKVKLC